jgi:hypothetical protein
MCYSFILALIASLRDNFHLQKPKILVLLIKCAHLLKIKHLSYSSAGIVLSYLSGASLWPSVPAPSASGLLDLSLDSSVDFLVSFSCDRSLDALFDLTLSFPRDRLLDLALSRPLDLLLDVSLAFCRDLSRERLLDRFLFLPLDLLLDLRFLPVDLLLDLPFLHL